MNSAAWVLIGESFLILVSLVIAITIYAWRKKRQLLTALDVLLTKLSEAESERKRTLTERLKNSCQVDEAKAKLLSNEIFCAERQFTQNLIQLLLNPETDKIAGFNEDMYALATPYWDLLSLDRMVEGLPVEQLGSSTAVPPVSSESEPESDGLPSEDYDLEVSVATAAAEDLETESTSTLTDSTPDIEIDEDDVVASSEVADQSIPTQDPNESDQNEEPNQSMSVPLAEEITTDKRDGYASAVPTQAETEQKSELMEPGDSVGDEFFAADIVEDKCLAEETTDSVVAEEEGDEPSWGDAFDEAAQEQEARGINLDGNDYEDGKSKKVPEL